jgi:FKBP-type peptidyl-prolyl cis-trans isomerase SlpA
MKIQPGSQVTMHFAMHLADGSVADSTKVNDLPGTLVIGDGTLTPGFEAHLMGLEAGAHVKFTAEPEDAFGMPNPQNIYIIPFAQFPAELELEPGLIVEFSQPNDRILPGMIRKLGNEGVTIDFNHPLAGQKIIFEVDIVDVE